MLNPDGVVYGNYRSSLLGVDLNRRWISPSKILHPTIYYTKQLVKMLDIDRTVELYTDIHGHSKKFNIFAYACCYPENSIDARNNNLVKVFPTILSERIEAFSFKDCRFANERDKEATARMVMFKEFNIIHSYTLEASFFGTEPPQPASDSESEENDDEIQPAVENG
jgi:murein tripeptide amidase MpaA